MFVAIVTLPRKPASLMISASFSWYFALSTLCSMPRLDSSRRKTLRLLDRARSDEHRLARIVPLDDLVDDGAELAFFVLVHDVIVVGAAHRQLVGIAMTSNP